MNSPDGAALGFSAVGDGRGAIRVAAGGSHRIGGLSEARKVALVGAVLALAPEAGTELVVLGVKVAGLRRRERGALRARVGFLSADGGLLSNLNAWENIVLPLGMHRPARLRGVEKTVYSLLAGLGADPHTLLGKLPEKMSLYEKKLAGYVRILLEEPELLLVEDLGAGLSAAEQASAAHFDSVYLANRPNGTFVRLETATGT